MGHWFEQTFKCTNSILRLIFLPLIFIIFSSLSFSTPAQSQSAPEILWEVRTLTAGLFPTQPFLNWTLSPGGWNLTTTGTSSMGTATSTSTFSGDAGGSSLSLTAIAESHGSLLSDSAANAYVIYQFRGYVKGPQSVKLTASSAASVSNQVSGGNAVSSASVGPIPFGTVTVDVNITGTGSESNSGGGNAVLPPSLTCGTGSITTFPQYPGVSYIKFHEGQFGAATDFASLSSQFPSIDGIANGSASFTAVIGSDDPVSLMSDPLVNGVPTPSPTIGSLVTFYGYFCESKNAENKYPNSKN